MNETSLRHAKLVSSGRAQRLSLVQRAQAPRAKLQLDGAIALADRHLLHVALPAPLGMALRKAHIVTELWRLATDSASASHAVHPLTIASVYHLVRCSPYSQDVNCTTTGRFVQTALQGTR